MNCPNTAIANSNGNIGSRRYGESSIVNNATSSTAPTFPATAATATANHQNLNGGYPCGNSKSARRFENLLACRGDGLYRQL